MLSLAALPLTGCSAAGVPSTAPDAGGGAGAGASSAPTQPCIVGVWNLDVGDYEAQSILYVNSLAVLVDDYYLNGSQTVSVTADGLFRLDTNISTGGESGARRVQQSAVHDDDRDLHCRVEPR